MKLLIKVNLILSQIILKLIGKLIEKTIDFIIYYRRHKNKEKFF